ncbi:MAG TPA: hypothetical protein EYP30_09095 [Archaeoglobaceae archaeon]|nr:hypothetical protein [Archaeoglobaceae archaeon]
MMDRKAKLIMSLGVLNGIYGNITSIVADLSDFISQNPDLMDEFREFGLEDILEKSMNLENLVKEARSRLMKEIY